MTQTARNDDAAAEQVRAARFASGLRAVAFGIASNTLLIVLKGTAGVAGHSQGLVADAVHSTADLANSLAAFTSLLISRRPGDWNHPYGHGRAEALAANFAAFIVGTAGLLVGWDALQKIRAGHGEAPAWLTLWVALFALVLKLGLAIYARRVARRIHSQAVSADARDHLTDVVATAFVIAGILVARAGYPVFDSLAGFVVAGFILYTAAEIFREAARELMETSLDRKLGMYLLQEVRLVPGAVAVTGIAGRTLADVTIVEVHIDVAPDMPARELGQVIDAIKQRLIRQAQRVAHVVVEANSSV
ncbi:MAG: cation diffusion facilitator family transporter, partial [Dehalococcoidia bacterium]